jgi:hypothetical protein
MIDIETYQRWLKEEPEVEWRCDCGGLIDCPVMIVHDDDGKEIAHQVSSARCLACGCRPSPPDSEPAS